MRKMIIVAAAISLIAAQLISADEPPVTYASAAAAYKAGDYRTFRDRMLKLVAQRPNQPLFLYDLAGGYALTGEPALAAATLEKVANYGVWFDLSDHDFDSVRKDARFQKAAARIEANHSRKISTSVVAYRLPEKGLCTEGISWDPKSKAFFVSSTRKRKIVRIDSSGAVRDFIAPASNGLAGVMAVKVDAPRGLLWASSDSWERMEGYDSTKPRSATLFAFRLDSGDLAGRYPSPRADGFYDDFTVAADGTVYASDPLGGQIDRLRPGASAIESWLPAGTLRSPQGLALSADGKTIYAADYSGAIQMIDVATQKASPLALPADFAPYGIDGLVRSGGSLIVVQNAVEPNRVVKLDLSPGGRSVGKWKILEMNQPLFDEPTLGTVGTNGDYFYLAASQGHLFDDGKAPAAGALGEGLILRIPLH